MFADNLTSLRVLTSKLELRRYLDTFSASPALAARRKLLLLSPGNITHANTCTRWEGYGNQHVCISVCMSVCSHISNNARQNFTKFSIHVICAILRPSLDLDYGISGVLPVLWLMTSCFHTMVAHGTE